MPRPLNPAALRVAATLKTHPVGTVAETLASALRNKRNFERQMLVAIAEHAHTAESRRTVRHCIAEYRKYADLHTILWGDFVGLDVRVAA